MNYICNASKHHYFVFTYIYKSLFEHLKGSLISYIPYSLYLQLYWALNLVAATKGIEHIEHEKIKDKKSCTYAVKLSSILLDKNIVVLLANNNYFAEANSSSSAC